MTNSKNLAKYLTSLYEGVPITEKAADAIYGFNFTVVDDRHYIITTIDDLIKKNSEGTTQTTLAVEVVDTDPVSFKINFVNGDKPQQTITEFPTVKDKSDKLTNLFKLLGAGVAPTGCTTTIFQDETDDIDSALGELEVISKAIDLIRQIERHEHELNLSSSPILGNAPKKESALTKYIEKIENLYLADLDVEQ